MKITFITHKSKIPQNITGLGFCLAVALSDAVLFQSSWTPPSSWCRSRTAANELNFWICPPRGWTLGIFKVCSQASWFSVHKNVCQVWLWSSASYSPKRSMKTFTYWECLLPSLSSAESSPSSESTPKCPFFIFSSPLQPFFPSPPSSLPSDGTCFSSLSALVTSPTVPGSN